MRETREKREAARPTDQYWTLPAHCSRPTRAKLTDGKFAAREYKILLAGGPSAFLTLSFTPLQEAQIGIHLWKSRFQNLPSRTSHLEIWIFLYWTRTGGRSVRKNYAFQLLNLNQLVSRCNGNSVRGRIRNKVKLEISFPNLTKDPSFPFTIFYHFLLLSLDTPPSFGRRGWISQCLPRLGGARLQ